MDNIEDCAAALSVSQSSADFQKIWQEAKSRWLRPKEIYDILNNHGNFQICTEPPNLPPSGTLILFDRKMLRNFRRDGHLWRKKKDNKTVKEAHEHLKVGSEEKIHVYYAHGEGESNLQRRVYWLLDKNLEHIVLVHYLQVKEGNRVNTQHEWQPNALDAMQLDQNPAYPSSSLFPAMAPVQSSGSSMDASSTPQLDLYGFDSNNDFDKFSLEDLQSGGETDMSIDSMAADNPWLSHLMDLTGQSQGQILQGSFRKETMSNLNNTQLTQTGNAISGLVTQPATFPGSNIGKEEVLTSAQGKPYVNVINTSSWEDFLLSANAVPRQGCSYGTQHLNSLQTPTLLGCTGDTILEGASTTSQVAFENQGTAPQRDVLPSSFAYSRQSDHIFYDKTDENAQQWPQSADFRSQMTWPESNHVPFLESQSDDGEEVLKKLDSLDRWMKRELPIENKSSPLALSVNSCSCTPMHEQVQRKTENTSNLASETQTSEELTPSSCPMLFYAITEFSPTWSFSSEEVKVIVTGQFMGEPQDLDKVQWYCRFGDVEVPAEIVQPGVLRCMSPKAAPGLVDFYVTDGSGQACSDCKRFEFRSITDSHKEIANSRTDHFFEDVMLQIRLAHLLLGNFENNPMSSQNLIGSIPPLNCISTMEDEWATIENLATSDCRDPCEMKELLLQMFFKQKLMDWASRTSQRDDKSLHAFDKLGQGVLHLASGLGYEWIIGLVTDSGMSIDFRDKKGWTALHWAAYYGREKMVAALLAAGAKPGMVSDPTHGYPSGHTPADVAASAGYDGIAGYLSECNLTSHLEVLTLSENEYDKESASQQGHRVMEYLKRSASLRKSVKSIEDELSLEDSLSAVGNATTAAARIHAAFRESSLKERLHAILEVDEYGLSPQEAHTLIAAQKIQKAYRKHREQKIKESAALQIQNRYRGWKSRKDYLRLRQNVIKIQAYFRMHQARKQYHKIIWSVGVLEKAILRWRQRGKGLRGFQAEVVSVEGCDDDDFLEIGRKQAEESLDRAVVRVQTMVRSRLARQQYRRMLENFKQAKG